MESYIPLLTEADLLTKAERNYHSGKTEFLIT